MAVHTWPGVLTLGSQGTHRVWKGDHVEDAENLAVPAGALERCWDILEPHLGGVPGGEEAGEEAGGQHHLQDPRRLGPG